jgi:hypothetical protein
LSWPLASLSAPIDRSGDVRKHDAEFSVAPLDGDAVEVGHAYTCQMKTTFYFHQKDINEQR